MTRGRMRIAGLALLGVPILVLLVFAFAEIAGDDLSGAQHLVQATPLLLLAVAAWRWPYQAGMALMVLGALLGLAYVLFLHPDGMTLMDLAVVEVVLFLPAVIAGALLTLSSATREADEADATPGDSPAR